MKGHLFKIGIVDRKLFKRFIRGPTQNVLVSSLSQAQKDQQSAEKQPETCPLCYE